MTVWVTPPTKVVDLSSGILEAVRKCTEGMASSPIGNFGLAGFRKWATEVMKWPKQFPGPALVECLMSTFIFIETGGTGGGAFRRMYSVFLREAALPDAVEPLGTLRKRIVQRNELFERGSEGWFERTLELNRGTDRLVAAGARALEHGAGSGIVGEMRELILELHGAETRAFEILGRAAGREDERRSLGKRPAVEPEEPGNGLKERGRRFD